MVSIPLHSQYGIAVGRDYIASGKPRNIFCQSGNGLYIHGNGGGIARLVVGHNLVGDGGVAGYGHAGLSVVSQIVVGYNYLLGGVIGLAVYHPVNDRGHRVKHHAVAGKVGYIAHVVGDAHIVHHLFGVLGGGIYGAGIGPPAGQGLYLLQGQYLVAYGVFHTVYTALGVAGGNGYLHIVLKKQAKGKLVNNPLNGILPYLYIPLWGSGVNIYLHTNRLTFHAALAYRSKGVLGPRLI